MDPSTVGGLWITRASSSPVAVGGISGAVAGFSVAVGEEVVAVGGTNGGDESGGHPAGVPAALGGVVRDALTRPEVCQISVKAPSRISCCSTAWTLLEPEDGADIGRREMRRSPDRTSGSMSGSHNPRNGHAP